MRLPSKRTQDQAGRLATLMVEGWRALAAASPEAPGSLPAGSAAPAERPRLGLKVLDGEGVLDRRILATLGASRGHGFELAL